MNRGLLISFEGSDGAGKSTQIARAKGFFQAKGIEPLMTREPGGTSISEKLRAILLDPANSEMDATAEMLIYASARAQLVAEVLRPALAEGRVIICDRYVDTSIAYQGYGRGLGDVVAEVNRVATGGLMPDLTIFLDLDPSIGRSRIRTEDYDRLEQEKLDFHYRVYEGFKAVAAKEPERVAVIDASRSIEEIAAAIEQRLQQLCEARGIL